MTENLNEPAVSVDTNSVAIFKEYEQYEVLESKIHQVIASLDVDYSRRSNLYYTSYFAASTVIQEIVDMLQEFDYNCFEDNR